VGDGRCADAALGADDRDGASDRFGIRRVEQPGDGPHDVDHADRADEVIADAAAHQLAIEHDVVELADDDEAGAGVAHLGKRIEAAEQVVGAARRLDDDDVGRGRGAIGFGRCGDAAHLDLQMGLRHAAVLARRLHGGGGVGVLAEGLNRDARNRRDMLVAPGRVGRDRLGLAGGKAELDHLPTSLILPASVVG
jgi:hypothetical protein